MAKANAWMLGDLLDIGTGSLRSWTSDGKDLHVTGRHCWRRHKWLLGKWHECRITVTVGTGFPEVTLTQLDVQGIIVRCLRLLYAHAHIEVHFVRALRRLGALGLTTHVSCHRLLRRCVGFHGHFKTLMDLFGGCVRVGVRVGVVMCDCEGSSLGKAQDSLGNGITERQLHIHPPIITWCCLSTRWLERLGQGADLCFSATRNGRLLQKASRTALRIKCGPRRTGCHW